MGDRECPNCGEMSLVEYGISKWSCLNCKVIFDDEDLDHGIDR